MNTIVGCRHCKATAVLPMPDGWEWTVVLVLLFFPERPLLNQPCREDEDDGGLTPPEHQCFVKGYGGTVEEPPL